jgi:hypothetical protein
MLRIAANEKKPLLCEHVDLLLDELRSWAKEVAGARWEPDRSAKIILREKLRGWWDNRTTEIVEGAKSPSGGKLARKMRDAALAEDQIRMAIELRSDYARTVRTSRYMEDETMQRLQSRVKSELASLRARFVAGEIVLDSTGFHSLCVSRMEAINSERPTGIADHGAFLFGCMYDVADRCLHQFARRPP